MNSISRTVNTIVLHTNIHCDVAKQKKTEHNISEPALRSEYWSDKLKKQAGRYTLINEQKTVDCFHETHAHIYLSFIRQVDADVLRL